MSRGYEININAFNEISWSDFIRQLSNQIKDEIESKEKEYILGIAECKFWHGAAELHKAISQLFDRYLTWRNSKVALILFITNKEFTKVIETIKSETVKHPYFLKEIGARGETSFSYQFHLPQDEDKKVYLEILAFHYDK